MPQSVCACVEEKFPRRFFHQNVIMMSCMRAPFMKCLNNLRLIHLKINIRVIKKSIKTFEVLGTPKTASAQRFCINLPKLIYNSQMENVGHSFADAHYPRHVSKINKRSLSALSPWTDRIRGEKIES